MKNIITSIYMCSPCGAVAVKDETCPKCHGAMENIGWYESLPNERQ